MGHDIFISYSTKDKVVADAVVSALENQSVRCWYTPRDVKPGADWGESITEAINESKIFLLIFSSNANQSKRVLDEVYYAISEEKTIIPFRIENLDPTGAMRLHLSSRHWLDAYHPSWREHIERLVNSVAASMGREMPLPEAQPTAPTPELRQIIASGKKPPWLWIGLAAILLVSLGIASAFWLINLGREADVQATAMAAGTQTAAADAIALAQEPRPTEAPISTPTEQPAPTDTPQIVEQEVVLNGYIIQPEDGLSLDPRQYTNVPSATIYENLFLSLTNYDIQKGEIVPEAAESWTISPDGRLYTFKLRRDIPWVLHTLGGETEQVIDENGEPRFITAQDFVDAFHSNCDPRVETGGLEYSLLGLLKGCIEVNQYEDPDNIPQELFESIGIRAIGDDELLVELEQSSGYFLSMTSLLTLSAVPQWAIDKYGTAWTHPGNMPTNGYYVIDSWTPEENMTWLRNPFLPKDIAGKGNVDRIEFVMLESDEEAYTLWLENQLDNSSIPQAELLNHRVNYASETTLVFEQSASYFVFKDIENPPFNNVHLRRAFAAAFDRAAYINGVLEGQGLPMKHLAPPIVFGAPPIDAVGVGYELAYAREELAAAGYPGCQGMPQFVLRIPTARYIAGVDDVILNWEKNLNCPEGTISIITGGPEVPSDISLVGWLSDYPDEHNWVGTLLACEGPVFSWHACSEIDDLIEQAAQEVDKSQRIEMYARIEEAAFGEEGDFPLIPIYWAASYFANHPWLSRTQPVMGRETYYDWIVDMDAKLAAIGD